MVRMENVYFLCPKCQKLYEYFKELFREEIVYAYTIRDDWMNDYTTLDVNDSKHLETQCWGCDFATEKYRAKDFAVILENGKVRAYGKYWKEHKEEFEEIANKIMREGIEKYIERG